MGSLRQARGIRCWQRLFVVTACGLASLAPFVALAGADEPLEVGSALANLTEQISVATVDKPLDNDTEVAVDLGACPIGTSFLLQSAESLGMEVPAQPGAALGLRTRAENPDEQSTTWIAEANRWLRDDGQSGVVLLCGLSGQTELYLFVSTGVPYDEADFYEDLREAGAEFGSFHGGETWTADVPSEESGFERRCELGWSRGGLVVGFGALGFDHGCAQLEVAFLEYLPDLIIELESFTLASNGQISTGAVEASAPAAGTPEAVAVQYLAAVVAGDDSTALLLELPGRQPTTFAWFMDGRAELAVAPQSAPGIPVSCLAVDDQMWCDFLSGEPSELLLVLAPAADGSGWRVSHPMLLPLDDPQPDPNWPVCVIDTTPLNFRGGPGTSWPNFDAIPVGDCTVMPTPAVELAESNGKPWRYVRWGDHEGWVSDLMIEPAGASFSADDTACTPELEGQYRLDPASDDPAMDPPLICAGGEWVPTF